VTVIDERALLANFSQQMDEDAAALFLGAGMSRPAGFVNWKELLRDIADELGLDIERETDLIALAQWHKNRRKTRHKINQVLVEEFTRDARLTENHRLIAALPVSAIWTTNYDHMIEDAFKDAKKRLDVKRRQKDLAFTKPRCHAILYKMHGDVDAPDEAVLTKDDFATFERTRGLFSTQLRGHLVSRSFLFLGYSFSDPNMDYILARIRAELGTSERNHYCVMRKVVKEGALGDADVEYQNRLLALRIEDLQNYGIQTLLVDEYADVTKLLRELTRRAVRKNVFVSGSAHDFAPLGRDRLEAFARSLGRELLRHDLHLVSGLGLGIGGAVTVGALEEVFGGASHELDDRLTLRPFPQVPPASGKQAELWERYRQEMIGRVGFAVFIAGNKLDDTGKTIEGSGVLREFEIAVEHGAYPIPIGATGHAAATLAARVLAEPEKFFHGFAPKVVGHLTTLNDAGAGEAKWLAAVIAIVKTIAPK
jgi:hypothetical protein